MKPTRWLMALTMLALVAAACGGGTAATTVAPTETTAAPTETTAAPTETTAGSTTGELPDLGGQAITVAVENAYPPFNFIDEATGEPAGWDYDAVGAICERLNCVPEFVETAWDGMIIAVSEGQFDVAADGITITEERKEQVDFSDGYISVEQRLMTRIDEDRFANVEEFAATDFLLGTQTGTTNYDVAVENFGVDRVEAYEQFGFAVQALINGDVDAVIIDDTAGQGYIGENAEAIKLIEGSLSSDQLGFIFPKGSELVAAFNAAMAALEADGTMADINTTWFPPIS
jgi:polar amino acid transport system substrate-binding protein